MVNFEHFFGGKSQKYVKNGRKHSNKIEIIICKCYNQMKCQHGEQQRDTLL